VATYNVHRCRGLDGRVRPARVAEVLRELAADVIALQEVLSIEDAGPQAHQAEFLAGETGMHWQLGENRRLRGGAYGNVVLSRLPMRCVRNYDLSVKGYERRGCLHTDVELDGRVLHLFNVHLGTDYLERRHQGRRLMGAEILLNRELNGPRLMLGDFNEWAPGLTTQLLSSHLKSVDIRRHLRRGRTYPGLLPFLHLDHIYHDEELDLHKLTLHRTRRALLASDHLPLVADFRLRPSAADATPSSS
jgi:endonuclease/exonuclease/phosphatase family metal-dependent hydrolase